jgi:hypothetical protein
MQESTTSLVAAMEALGNERQAMVTLSFNPYNGDRGWIAFVSRSRAIGFGPSPEEAFVDLQAKLEQEDKGVRYLAS